MPEAFVTKEELMETVPCTARTRRASLMALGAAGLAGLAHPIALAAKKKKGKKGSANKRCTRQAGDWTILVTAECDGDPGCLEALACGDALRSCNFGGFLTCLIE